MLLRQVDDFCTRCTEEQDVKNIYNLIGAKIQFQSKQEKGDVPFKYLGLVTDYNGSTALVIGIHVSSPKYYSNVHGKIYSIFKLRMAYFEIDVVQ